MDLVLYLEVKNLKGQCSLLFWGIVLGVKKWFAELLRAFLSVLLILSYKKYCCHINSR